MNECWDPVFVYVHLALGDIRLFSLNNPPLPQQTRTNRAGPRSPVLSHVARPISTALPAEGKKGGGGRAKGGEWGQPGGGACARVWVWVWVWWDAEM